MNTTQHKFPVRLGSFLMAALLALPLSLFASCDENDPKPGTDPADTTLSDTVGGENGGEDPTDPSTPTDPSVPTDPSDDPVVDPGTDNPDDPSTPDVPANPNHPGDSSLYKGVMIHSVYGTGKKGAEALISNGYVQLYNASDKDIALSGASLYYKSDGNNPFDQFVFPAGAIIPAGGYYLVRANAPADFVESNAVMKVEHFDAEWDVYLDNKEIRLLLAPSGWSVGRDEDITTFKDAISVFVATMAHHESVYALYDLSRNKVAVRTALEDYSGYHTVNLTRSATPELRKLRTKTSDGTVNEVVGSKLNEVLFSADAGIYEKAFVLTLKAKEGYKIYYTTDGSDPSVSTNKNRKLYSSGIQLSNTSAMGWGPLTNSWTAPAVSTQIGGHVIKACATNGTETTDVFTNTYFITDDLEKYGVTIMSISMPKEEVIGTNGFYNNFYATPGVITGGRNRGTGIIEFFDPTGNRVGNSRVEMAVSGNGSSGFSMRSLRLYFKGINNQDSGLESDLHYDIFGGKAKDQHGQAITSFSRLMIRNSGNDCNTSYIRDAFMQSTAAGLNVDFMASATTLVFINGEFWGVYNMRERYSPEYVESHYGVDKENVTVIESDYSQVHTNQNADFVVSSGVEGDQKPFNDMVQYMRTHNLSDQASYDYVASLMDIDSFIDMWVVRLFYVARDWPENNIKVWRNKNPNDPSGFDTKWHFTLLDLDMGLAFYDFTRENENFFWAFDSNSVCGGMMRSLMQNPGFREQFIVRYYEVVKYHMTPENLTPQFEALYAERTPLMAMQAGRWGNDSAVERGKFTVSKWQGEAGRIRSFLNNRQPIALEHFYNYFRISESDIQNLTSQRVTVGFQENRVDVTVNGQAVKSGHFIELEQDQTVTIKVKASVKEGFVITSIVYTDMSGQTQSVEGVEATFTVSKSGTISVYTKRANINEDELKQSTLVAGATYLFYLTGNGELYAWGDNRYGVLGLNSSEQVIKTPTFVMENVAKVVTASGNDYENGNAVFATAILTKDGKLYTVGRNEAGQLGRNGTSDDYKLGEVKTSFKVVDISMGHDHLLVLDAAGNLWGVGSNRNGALGAEGAGGNLTTFVKIDTNVELITAGRRTTAYVKTDGSMWGLGDNRWRKISATHGDTLTTPIKLMSNVVFMDSGEHEMLAVDTSGKLFYAGWRTLNGFGQGGGNDPAFVQVMTGVKEADIYFSDMIILTTNGDVYAYGTNNGNCTGVNVTSGAPKKLRSGVLDVAAGYAFTAYLLQDGTILVQGDNSYGQAGNGTAGGSVNMGEVDF